MRVTTHKINHLLSIASVQHEIEGVNWYHNASDICLAMADEFNQDYYTVCALMANFSVNKGWKENIKVTEHFLQTGEVKHFGFVEEKAKEIINSPKEKYRQILKGKTGLKVENFYLNILRPNDDNPVTIDRHAWDIIGGEGKITIPRYHKAVQVYKRAAKKHGLLPNQVQAITWIIHRELKGVSHF